MKKVNKVLVFFLLGTLVLSFGIGELLQSKYSAHFISKQMSKVIDREIAASMSFEKVRIQFFPPGITVSGVELHRSKDRLWEAGQSEIKGDIYLDDIELHFDLLKLFKNEVSFRTVIVSGGSVELEVENKKTSKDVKVLLGNISYVRKIISTKIRNIILKEIKVSINKNSFYSKYLNLSIYPKTLLLNLNLYSVHFSDFKGGVKLDGGVDIDEVKAQIEMGDAHMSIEHLYLALRDDYVFGEGIVFEGDPSDMKSFKYSGDIGVRSSSQEIIRNFFPKIRLSGLIDFDFKFKGRGTSLGGRGNFYLENFRTPHLNIPNGKGSFKVVEQDVIVTSIDIDNVYGKLKVSNSFKVVNLSKKELYPIKISANVESLRLNKFLSLKGAFWNNLEVILTGAIQLKKKGGMLEVSSRNLFSKKIYYAAKEKQIIHYRNSNLKNINFDINLNTGSVKLEAELELKKTLGKISGRIGKKINVVAIFDKIDLKEVLSIKNLDILGTGSGRVVFKGIPSNAWLEINLKTKESAVLGYRLGAMDANIDLFLNKSFLKIKDSKARRLKSIYFVEGEIDYKSKTHIDLRVKTKRSTYRYLKDLIFPLSSKVNFLPKETSGYLQGHSRIWGYTDGIKVSGQYLGKQLNLNVGVIPMVSLDFLYKGNIIELKNIIIKKGSGFVNGSYTFDKKKREHQYEFLMKKIKIYEFENINPKLFGLSGDIYAAAKGKVVGGNVSGKVDFSLRGASIEGVSVPDSSGVINLQREEGSARMSIFGDDIVLKTNFFWGSQKDLSNIQVNVDTTRIKELLSIFFPHNIEKQDISGAIRAMIRTDFSLRDLERLNASIQIQDFMYKSEGVQLEKSVRKNKLVIADGMVEEGEILLEGPKSKLSIKSYGSVEKDINLELLGKMNASIVEIFDRNILKSNGELLLKSSLKFSKYIKNRDINFSLHGKGINALYSGIPAPFEDLNFLIVLESGKIHFKKLIGKLGGGSLTMGGDIFLNIPSPVFNLKYTLDNSRMRFSRKTNIWISSQGEILGKGIPYIIKGNVSIVNGSSFDEFKNLRKKTSNKYINLYIPTDKKNMALGLFHVDLKLKTIRPIYIRNSLAELNMHTRVHLSGNLFLPKVEGKIEFIPGTGKLYFRNNDFVLKDGIIQFDKKGISGPFFDFTGVSKVQEYEIALKISGYQDDFVMELRSTPPLIEKEILSLLVLGVTSESASRLSEGDQDSVASLGIGSLIFKRFRINQELKSELGVDLSLSSEVVEDEKDYLNESNQLGRRNAAKISLNKKITENISIKASSTLGGDISKKQEMNVNYNINKNLSLEGIYELKNSEEEEGETSDSIGSDVKFRIEF